MASSFALFSLSLLLLVQNADGAKSGIVGFGLSLYQDSCCLACHDSLSSLYLSCTAFPDHGNMSGMPADMDMDMDMEMMGTTTEECRTSNMPWLQTMAYCIKQACTPHGYTEEMQADCFSVHAVAGASEPTFHDSLPASAPTIELSENATWLNTTRLVNQHLYHATHGTLEEFARSEYIHTRYSMILYLIVIGTCLIWGVKIQLASVFFRGYRQLQDSTFGSKLRQHIALPALFGSRHLEPLPANLGYVPGRALGISISIYVVLNIIFSSISFGSFQPNIYWPSQQVELCEYVGNRTGMLSLVNLSIAILFAGRNNVLIAITGWSQTTFLTLHRWVARVATLQAIVHSAAYTLQYVDPRYDGAETYAEKAAEPFYWWGIIGTIALSLATAFAILPIRITLYELFLTVHIVLIILALVACWYHLVPHFGFKYGYQVWLYICFAFWSADRLARLARILYYNRLGDAKAIVEVVPGCGILHVTVFPRITRGIGPGQHTFLYFPGLGKFWESHPFSIAAWETRHSSVRLASSSLSASDGNEVCSTGKELDTLSPAIASTYQVKSTATPHQEAVPHESQKYNDVSFQLLIRAHSGMTAALKRYLSSPATASRVEVSVYTEGYYAGHHATLQPLYTADTVLCLVGGLGITNALGFVQEYVGGVSLEGEAAGKTRGVMRRAKRFILAWSAKEIAFIDHVKKNFLANAQGVECLFWYTGSPEDAAEKSESPNKGEIQGVDSHALKALDATVTAGRMHIGTVIKSALEVERQTTVLVCGPGQMADEARKQVVKCVKDGFSVDLIEEAFAW
ncbi:ferric reductase like transmembrane component-domain-containing protein [Xylaria longipes]|nr:ferric reductase like transmembrane component-domain-containing protein [Xylaria longipes]